MKKITSLLLSFVLIISSFVFPVNAYAVNTELSDGGGGALALSQPLPTDGVDSHKTPDGTIKVGQVISGCRTTGYCSCSICNGSSNSKKGYTETASGMKLYQGMQEPYAVANNYYPLGTILLFNNTVYTVVDRGAKKYFDNLTHLDVFCTGSHKDCGLAKYNQENGTIKILYLPKKDNKKINTTVDYNTGAKVITSEMIGNKTNFYQEIASLQEFPKELKFVSQDSSRFDGDVKKILDEINAEYAPTYSVPGGSGGSGLGYGEYTGYFSKTPSGTDLRNLPKGAGIFISPLPNGYTHISGGFPTYSSGRSHSGVDLPCPVGTTVSAAADGVVTKAGDGSNYGSGMWTYGKLVEIRHANGFVTRYGHNSQIKVIVGQHVKQGDLIALSGNTGNSSGPHCHFQVRLNGVNVNPPAYM